MSRYIDADNLHNAKFQDISGYGENVAYRVGWNDAIDAICENEPSIDIEPKRGEWKPFDLTWGRSIWYCTACEESTEVPCDIWKHKPIYKYCPNCGAKMKGADDEDN